MSRRVRIGGNVLRLIALCTLVFGCRDVATIWSTNSVSPDGQWVASARTDQYGGPGTAGILSTVTLKPVKGKQGEIEILQLSQETPSINLKLIWLTPTYLEVTYKQPASINFQAIKCGGIDILVRAVMTH